VNKRDVKDGRDADLTQEPEMIRAFRDTWELGIHSYLTYLRDRLLLTRELLNESGSCFVQIGPENLHHVRELMDEVFGSTNFRTLIAFKSTSALGQEGLAEAYNYLVWYAKDIEKIKFRPLFKQRDITQDKEWRFLDDEELPAGYKKLTEQEFATLEDYSGLFRRSKLTSSGFTESCIFTFELDGTTCKPFGGKSWATTRDGMQKLISINRLFLLGGSPYFKQYFADFPVMKLDNNWPDQPAAESRVYVVQTAPKFIQRCMLMTTDPGDLVLDPTCGSGTTAYVAEQWGRRWVTCDTSRVAITLAKQRLMAQDFAYYELAHPEEGVGSGFRYRSVPHITLKSITNNPEIREGMIREQIDSAIARYSDQETLFDQPDVNKGRVRVTGPFTVEAVPAPTVRSLEDIEVAATGVEPVSTKAQQSLADFRYAATPLLDASVTRSGATLRHTEWRDELLKTGLRGKGGNQIDFSRVEPLAGTRWLHADAETKGKVPERVVISFGPEHSLLDPRQVESAWQEARTLIPRPAMIVFAAFEFDPQAAKEIDELTKEKTGMTFLSAQMNADLLTADLKKKRASNQSFWLVGRPDVDLRKVAKGDHKGKWEIEVKGFDYYNTRTGTIDSGDTSKIAMWLLDTDYDGRSLYPRQVFFPLADSDGGWARLAKNLKAEIDLDLIEAYRGTVSLPFEPGNYVAVKVIDDRGIESLKVVEVK
jgi:adenine-specific DNA-methyltransferase